MNKKINIEELNDEDLNTLSAELGIKVRDIVDNAIVKANKLLKSYGMEAKMEVVIREKVLEEK